MAKFLEALNVGTYVTGQIKHRIPVRAMVQDTSVDLSLDWNGISFGGVTLAVGDRVCMESGTITGGIYVVGDGAGETKRAPDFDDNIFRATFSVTEGTLANTIWEVLTSDFTVPLELKMIQNLNYGNGTLTTGGIMGLEILSAPANASHLRITGNTIEWQDSLIATGNYSQKAPARFDTLLDVADIADTDLTSATIYNIGAETVNVGDRILVRNQTDPIQNGVYKVTTAGANGVLERAIDFVNPYVHSGDNLIVQKTSARWTITGTDAISVGSDPINFTSDVGTQLDFVLIPDRVVVNNSNYLIIGYFSYQIAKYGASKSANIFLENQNGAIDFQVYNSTTNTVITTSTLSAGFNTVSFTTPAADTRLSIRVKRSTNSTGNIYGIQLRI